MTCNYCKRKIRIYDDIVETPDYDVFHRECFNEHSEEILEKYLGVRFREYEGNEEEQEQAADDEYFDSEVHSILAEEALKQCNL